MNWHALITKPASAARRLLGDRSEPSQAGAGGTVPATFAEVYEKRLWGRKPLHRFFSGPGSHDPEVIRPYIDAVRGFLAGFDRPPPVVDLGCGDFNVGRRLRDSCDRYVACDVVPELIEHNRKTFAALEVEFICLDIVADPLPAGDVVFVRQVLQHLSNAQVVEVLRKLSRYRFLVITEHLPDSDDFVPNLDHEGGAGIRVARGSGVVLTAPPFGLAPRATTQLCRVKKYGGCIVTTLHQLT